MRGVADRDDARDGGGALRRRRGLVAVVQRTGPALLPHRLGEHRGDGVVPSASHALDEFLRAARTGSRRARHRECLLFRDPNANLPHVQRRFRSAPFVRGGRGVAGFERHGEDARAFPVDGVKPLSAHQRMAKGGEPSHENHAEVVEVGVGQTLALHSASNAVGRHQERRADRLRRGFGSRFGFGVVGIRSRLGSARASAEGLVRSDCLDANVDVSADAVLAAESFLVAHGARAEANGAGFEPRDERLAHFVSGHAKVGPGRRRASLGGQEGGAVISEDAAGGVEGPVRARAGVARAKLVEDAQARERRVGLAEGDAVALSPRSRAGIALKDNHARARLGGGGLDRRREGEARDAPAGDHHHVVGAETVRARRALPRGARLRRRRLDHVASRLGGNRGRRGRARRLDRGDRGAFNLAGVSITHRGTRSRYATQRDAGAARRTSARRWRGGSWCRLVLEMCADILFRLFHFRNCISSSARRSIDPTYAIKSRVTRLVTDQEMDGNDLLGAFSRFVTTRVGVSTPSSTHRHARSSTPKGRASSISTVPLANPPRSLLRGFESPPKANPPPATCDER